MSDGRRATILDGVRATAEFLSAALDTRNYCCLAAEVLRAHLAEEGVASRIVPCRVITANRVVVDHFGGLDHFGDPSLGSPPDDGAVGLLGYEAQPTGAGLTRLIPAPATRDAFPGHLVLTTRNPDMLLDPTISQVSSPDSGVDLEDAVIAEEIDRASLRAFERGAGGLGADSGDFGILYSPAPDLDYRLGMGWDDDEVWAGWREMREKILATLRGDVRV